MKTKQPTLNALARLIQSISSHTTFANAENLERACDDVGEAFAALEYKIRWENERFTLTIRAMEAERDYLKTECEHLNQELGSYLHENARLHRIIDGLREQLEVGNA